MVTTALAISSLPPPAQCQENAGGQTDEPWYQVEVIVFRHLDPDEGNEAFSDRPPELRYPEKLHWLSASRSEREALRAAELASEFRPPELLAAPEEEPEEPLEPGSYERLDQELRQLNEVTKSLRYSRGYRVLFHEAWRQTFPSRAHPSNVLITGGEPFDDHFELEGSISLSLSRYLHLETRLWLNQFAPIHDGPAEAIHLPPLPPPPPPIESENTEVESQDGEQQVVVVTLDPDGVPNFGGSALNPVSDSAPDVTGTAPENRTYELETSWLMHQRRRLRSGELHYVDHPLFGMLIYVEPWERAVIEN